MKTVTQKDGMGCGVACVASLTGSSYGKTLKLFTRSSHSKTKGFFCRDIVKALEKSGKTYVYNYLKVGKKNLVKPGCIVYIKKSNEYPAGHYLAKSNRGWMDPWINFPATPRKSGWRKRLPGKPIYIIHEEK